MCSCVRDEMTAAAGGVLKVEPWTQNLWAQQRWWLIVECILRGGAVRGSCPSVPHLRLECTEAEHELRYVFSSARYSRFGGP